MTPGAYKNSNGHNCKYPKAIAEIYSTGETEKDKEIAKDIHRLLLSLKGINYLQKLNFPLFLNTDDEKKQYLIQRFNSAPALATFEIKSSLRSSHVALYEYLYGTDAALKHFRINSTKAKSGNIFNALDRCKNSVPKIKFPNDWLPKEHHWILNEKSYTETCEKEINLYEQIGKLCLQLSEQRELSKAKTLIEKVNQFGKVLAFDSTVLTLDYLKHLLENQKSDADIIVATGQSEKNKNVVKENFALNSKAIKN